MSFPDHDSHPAAGASMVQWPKLPSNDPRASIGLSWGRVSWVEGYSHSPALVPLTGSACSKGPWHRNQGEFCFSHLGFEYILLQVFSGVLGPKSWLYAQELLLEGLRGAHLGLEIASVLATARPEPLPLDYLLVSPRACFCPSEVVKSQLIKIQEVCRELAHS